MILVLMSSSISVTLWESFVFFHNALTHSSSILKWEMVIFYWYKTGLSEAFSFGLTLFQCTETTFYSKNCQMFLSFLWNQWTMSLVALFWRPLMFFGCAEQSSQIAIPSQICKSRFHICKREKINFCHPNLFVCIPKLKTFFFSF